MPFQKFQAYYVMYQKDAFLIYVNDMPMSVKCNLFLNVDNTGLVVESKNVEVIEK